MQASEDDHDLDMLASRSENTLECQSIQQRDESSKERCDDIHTIESNVEDNVIQNKLASKKDTISEEGSTTGIVCLVQATRIPTRQWPSASHPPPPPTRPPPIDSIRDITGIEKTIQKTSSIQVACGNSYEMIAI